MALGRESAYVMNIELRERAQALARAIVEQGAQIPRVRFERMRGESALVLDLL
jgi:hypothetical protein